jgi:hypothetical protein
VGTPARIVPVPAPSDSRISVRRSLRLRTFARICDVSAVVLATRVFAFFSWHTSAKPPLSDSQ